VTRAAKPALDEVAEAPAGKKFIFTNGSTAMPIG